MFVPVRLCEWGAMSPCWGAQCGCVNNLLWGAQVGKEEEAKQEEEAFAEENIDQILAGRSEKRQIGSRKGNTFSTATFSTNEVLPRPCTELFLYPFSCHPPTNNLITFWFLLFKMTCTVSGLVPVL